MTDKILTLHPQGKKGVSISRQKYEIMRGAILGALREQGDLTFAALGEAVEQRLGGSFDGSVMWYVTCIKLDLEARGLIERVPKSAPQRLHLVE